MKALLKAENVVFIKVPTVNAPKWPEHIRKQFRTQHRDVAQEWEDKDPEQDWIYVEICGTTFSGHSTKTTLGNTLRTLCYSWYYQIEAGISNTPWDCDRSFTIASGDDGVIFVEPNHVNRLVETIRRLCTTNTEFQTVGLGQCVKEIKVG